MKKFLKFLPIVTLAALLFVGCGAKPDKTASSKPEPDKEVLCGGWTKAADPTVTDDLKEIFTKATKDLEGAQLVPVKLLETQVVAGMNYRFLCDSTPVVPDAVTTQVIVTVYRDLDGNCTMTDCSDVS